mgnify:CR=1 FL=1
MGRREALLRAGEVRFRPVILTAVTTALGLIPLAIGLNFDFFGLYTRLEPELYWGGEQAAMWGPMAIAVIIGILFATFLTLILVPVLYSVVDDTSEFFKRNFTHAGEEPVEQVSPEETAGETWGADTRVADRPEGVGAGGTEPKLEPTGAAPTGATLV